MKSQHLAFLIAGWASTVVLHIWAQSAPMPDPILETAEAASQESSPAQPGSSPQEGDATALPVTVSLPQTSAEAEALEQLLYPEYTPLDEPVAEAFSSRWNARLRASLGMRYDNNILLSSRSKQSDLVFTLTPGLTLARGDFESRKANYILLDYAPSALLYTRHSNHNAVNHDANAGVQWRKERYTLLLKARFLDITGPNTDIGRYTRWQVYESDLLARNELSEKTALEASLRNRVINYRDGLDSVEWTANGWWSYRHSPKLTAATGLAAGQLTLQDSDAQTYLRPQLRASYQASEKLSAEGAGGLDIRWFGSGAGERVNPVWEAGACYLPTEAAALKMSVYRRIEGAASIIGADYTLTGAAIELRYTLSSRFELALIGGYERSDYHSISPTPAPSRHDNYFYTRPALRAVFSDKLNVDLFCQYRRNVADPGNYGFSNIQAGVTFCLSY